MAVGGDFVEDLVGCFRPDDWSRVLVPVGEPGSDVAFQSLDGAVDAALEFLLREFVTDNGGIFGPGRLIPNQRRIAALEVASGKVIGSLHRRHRAVEFLAWAASWGL